jgi:hypothetical protein
MSRGPVAAHGLADFKPVQKRYYPASENKADKKRRKGGKRAAERQVTKNIERGKKFY